MSNLLQDKTLLNWVASAWKKLDKRPALVSKSFKVTGITVNNDNESVRNEEVQEEIATRFDANATDNNSEEESEADEDSEGENCDNDCSNFLSKAIFFFFFPSSCLILIL